MRSLRVMRRKAGIRKVRILEERLGTEFLATKAVRPLT